MSGSISLKPTPIALGVLMGLQFASAAQAVSTDIVISEFRTRGPNGGSDEFIELLNISANPVNIGGWKINGSSSGGVTGTRLTINANTTLNPGCRFLATNNSTSGGPYSGSVPGDQTYATGIADNGGLAVLNVGNVIIDQVGMVAGSAYKEGTVLAQTTNNVNQSYERKPAALNNQDTDNNANDFILNASSSNPQNLAACGGGTTVNLSVSANAGTEAGQTVITVTATASAAVVGAQTVNLAVTGTDVTAGDYTLSNTVITIANGATTGSVTFTVVDDALAEVNETAILTISNPSAGIVLGATTSQNITITDNDAVNACGGVATKIHTVQGTGSASLLDGTQVTIEGIVVGDYQGTASNSLQGFFVQEEDADADANLATSEGIFVYDGGNALANGIAVGDKVRVTGTVDEFFNMTEIDTLTAVSICASNQTPPTAASLTLPVPITPTGNLTTDTAAINAYYEQFEGMLVSFPTTLSVSEYFQLERYGQIVLSQGGRVPTFTAANVPGVAAYTNHQIDVARRKVILDDLNNTQNAALVNATSLFLPPPGLSTTNRFRGGDTIANLTGVLHWSWAGFGGTDAWRVRPVTERFGYSFTSANPRPSAAPVVDGSLKVASFNVLNYFTTIDTTLSNDVGTCGPSGTLDCRGADSAAELTRQTNKAVAALCKLNADVVGLVEIENNASASLSALTTAANAVSNCGPYSFVNTGTIGTDAIKVGFIYKNTKVALQGSHAVLTSAFNANFIDTKNRPVLAQTFRELVGNGKFTVAVNHLKSKGSDCLDVADPDTGDGQGNCNLTRKKAAEVLVDWLATDPTASGDPDFLIIGDLNSYDQEDPIVAIKEGPDDALSTGDDYTDLVALFGGPLAYSYVFDGQTGYLDYAIAGSTMLPQVVATEQWHINADEPPAFDYNDAVDDVGEADFEPRPITSTTTHPLFAADEFRTSDHDIVVVGLALDTDGDGLPDSLEATTGTNPLDVDSDDDGIADGVEDADRDGVVDAGETNPRMADSDGDGIQDGTETGVTVGIADPDGAGPLLGTGAGFVPDADPLTTTLPTDSDTDNDGLSDGAEDANQNGRIDGGESDPNSASADVLPIPALGFWPMLLLSGWLARIGFRRSRRG